MGTNLHTAYVDDSTGFSAPDMNAPLSELDKAITYATGNLIVHCDGNFTWSPSTNTLSWDGTIRIVFNRADGQAIENTIAASSITISDNQFFYVTLSETNGAVLSKALATVATGAASNFLTLGRVVLAYRNTSSNDIFFVHLPVRPHYIKNQGGTALTRRATLNFAGNPVVASDDAVNDRTNVTIRSGQVDTTVVSYGATINLDLDSYNVADVTLTGDPTINFINGIDGQEIVLRLRQDGVGSRTVTWGTMVRFSTDVPSPTLSTAPNSLDYLVFRLNEEESSAQYDCILVNRGF